MKSYSRLFCLSMLALAAGASVSAQSLTAEQKAYASRLSGAARLQWLRKMGITPLAQKARAPFKIQPLALSSPLANVLVNDPTLDDAALLNGASDDAQNETTLLLIPGGVFVAAYNDGGSTANGLNAFSGYSRSTDGGGSFTDLGALPIDANGDAGDPVLARSEGTGTVFLSALFGVLDPAGIQLFRSVDNGLSFHAPINAAPGFGSGDFCDKEWIAVDNFPGAGQGNVYVVFENLVDTTVGAGLNPDGMYLCRSVDGGTTWTPPGGFNVAVNGCEQGAFPVIGLDHRVYVFRWDCTSAAADRIRVVGSTNFASSFGSSVTVATLVNNTGDLGLIGGGVAFRTDLFPRAAVNPVNGNLYCVFADAAAGDKADIYFTRSSNNGANWTARVRVNDDATTNDQWQPVLTVNPDGTRVFIAWYDRRDDPGNDRIKTFGAIGRVDPVTGEVTFFCENFPISNTDFPAYVLDFGDPALNYMGDYDQAVADKDFFYYTWGDNRLSNSFDANQADVRFASVPQSGFARLNLASVSVVGGNNDGSVGLNQCLNLSVTLTNTSCADEASELTVALATSSSGVFIEAGESSIPAIAVGQGRSNSIPFVVSTSRHLACGTQLDFVLTVKSAIAGSYDIPFQLPVSIVNTNPVAQFNNSASITISDGSTVESSVFPSGLGGIVADVVVSVYVQHTFDADVTMTLVAPDGTEVELTSGNGGGGDNYGVACSNSTTFSDAAASLITSGTAPFVGSFRPEQALSTLAGKNPNGEWKLRIVDGPALDSGTFQCWSLFLTTGTCGTGPGPCVTRPDVCLSADSLDFGLRPLGTTSASQSLIITNCGTAPLNVSNLFFVGANAGDFSIVNENCTDQAIPVDGICQVGIVYSPRAEGAAEAALIIIDDTPDTFHFAFMDGTGTASQPDASISKRLGEKTFVGNDIYNTTGDFQQASARLRGRRTRSFYVRYQNDGISTDRFLVHGSAEEGISVRYFLGARRGEDFEITDAVNAGTFLTSTLAGGAEAGEATLIRIEIAADPLAGTGFYSAFVTFTSTVNSEVSDTVKATSVIR